MLIHLLTGKHFNASDKPCKQEGAAPARRINLIGENLQAIRIDK